jgi:hypothetical protein
MLEDFINSDIATCSVPESVVDATRDNVDYAQYYETRQFIKIRIHRRYSRVINVGAATDLAFLET